ncbi:hypothetical protein BJY52DRAFT_1416024 [Lactarius psammicola]|nr:hypothetical protein BJY52DRAFT_1416024 [Lactarius psammicola]
MSYPAHPPFSAPNRGGPSRSSPSALPLATLAYSSAWYSFRQAIKYGTFTHQAKYSSPPPFQRKQISVMLKLGDSSRHHHSSCASCGSRTRAKLNPRPIVTAAKDSTAGFVNGVLLGPKCIVDSPRDSRTCTIDGFAMDHHHQAGSCMHYVVANRTWSWRQGKRARIGRPIYGIAPRDIVVGKAPPTTGSGPSDIPPNVNANTRSVTVPANHRAQRIQWTRGAITGSEIQWYLLHRIWLMEEVLHADGRDRLQQSPEAVAAPVTSSEKKMENRLVDYVVPQRIDGVGKLREEDGGTELNTSNRATKTWRACICSLASKSQVNSIQTRACEDLLINKLVQDHALEGPTTLDIIPVERFKDGTDKEIPMNANGEITSPKQMESRPFVLDVNLSTLVPCYYVSHVHQSIAVVDGTSYSPT